MVTWLLSLVSGTELRHSITLCLGVVAAYYHFESVWRACSGMGRKVPKYGGTLMGNWGIINTLTTWPMGIFLYWDTFTILPYSVLYSIFRNALRPGLKATCSNPNLKYSRNGKEPQGIVAMGNHLARSLCTLLEKGFEHGSGVSFAHCCTQIQQTAA